MVEPVTISTAAVALLVPYLAKIGEGALTKLGEDAATKAEETAKAMVSELYQTIRRKFAKDKDTYAEQTLERLKDQPENEGRQAALADVIKEKAQEDPGFAYEVDRLTRDATQSQGITPFLTQVYDNAKVGKITNIGQARNVSF